MLMTVTNTSATLTLNDFDTYNGFPPPFTGPGVNAVGGARKYPLPYPFGHIVLAPLAASPSLPVHPADFRKGGAVLPWQTMSPSDEWNQVIQSGLVTVVFAAEVGRRDTEELFLASV